MPLVAHMVYCAPQRCEKKLQASRNPVRKTKSAASACLRKSSLSACFEHFFPFSLECLSKAECGCASEKQRELPTEQMCQTTAFMVFIQQDV